MPAPPLVRDENLYAGSQFYHLLIWLWWGTRVLQHNSEYFPNVNVC